jgi:hypothetical protein
MKSINTTPYTWLRRRIFYDPYGHPEEEKKQLGKEKEKYSVMMELSMKIKKWMM